MDGAGDRGGHEAVVPLPEIIYGYQRCLEELANRDALESIGAIAETLAEAGEVFICGNGGSAATGSHFAADLRRAGVKATCLSDNIPIITAIANDERYEDVFSQQLQRIRSDDILVLITGSGNSPNLLKAADVAKWAGAKRIGLLGFGGGKLRDEVNLSVVLKSRDYGEVEGVHSCLCHIIPGLIKEIKGAGSKT